MIKALKMHKALKKILVTGFEIALLSFVSTVSAHEASGTMDVNGNVAGFTGFAQFGCFDDGNGPPDHFVISIADHSPPQDNLLVSAQVISRSEAANTTDPVSGDGQFSPEARVQTIENGTYFVLVNKTGPGARDFTLNYHCMTIDNAHTGTNDPILIHYQ